MVPIHSRMFSSYKRVDGSAISFLFIQIFNLVWSILLSFFVRFQMHAKYKETYKLKPISMNENKIENFMVIAQTNAGPDIQPTHFSSRNNTTDPIERLMLILFSFFVKSKKNSFCVEPENFKLLLHIVCIVQMNLNLLVKYIEKRCMYYEEKAHSIYLWCVVFLLFSIHLHLFFVNSNIFTGRCCRAVRVEFMQRSEKKGIKVEKIKLSLMLSAKVSTGSNQSYSQFSLKPKFCILFWLHWFHSLF